MDVADIDQRRATKISSHSKAVKKNSTPTKVSDSLYSTNGSTQSQSHRSCSSSTKSSNSVVSGKSNLTASSGYGGRTGKAESTQELTEVDVEAEAEVEVKAEVQDGEAAVADTAATENAGAEPVRDAEGDRADSPGVLRAAFSQTLSCLCGHGLAQPKEEPPVCPSTPEGNVSTINCPTAVPETEEFTVVVSMEDGAVVYSSPGITGALGFPRDMWAGRSFVDYVHPDDRLALITHITSGVALPPVKKGATGGDSKLRASASQSLFCRLRRYPALRDGFAVLERGVHYRPFSLSLSFCEVRQSGERTSPAAPANVLLTVTATSIGSAYTKPRQEPEGGVFATRHLADGRLTHVDSAAVPLMGYLPHILADRPIFDLYHPSAMPALRHVYHELVSREQVTPLRSKPYKMRVQNGGYILVDTEWSSFVNPWSRQLEFVIGQHRVLEGPNNPDVFAEPMEEEQFSEEVLGESKKIQDEICKLLKEDVKWRTPTVDRGEVSRRCKDLACLIESLADHRRNLSERGSVTLGEISPHHDTYDSKSSSETPPSYNQLNYNENLQRFFESEPKTVPSEGSNVMGMSAGQDTTTSTDDDSKTPGTTPPEGQLGSPAELSGANDHFTQSHLTEEILTRHNEDMEKVMAQKHREQRSKGSESKGKKQHTQQQPQQPEAHGTKRSGSHSWDGEPLKASKTSHCRDVGGAGPGPPPPMEGNGGMHRQPPVSLWPPFSVAVTPNHGSCCSGGWCGAPPPLLPLYYLPTTPVVDQTLPTRRQQQQRPPAAAVPLMIYQQPPPLLYPLAPPPPPSAPPPLPHSQQRSQQHLPSMATHTRYQPPPVEQTLTVGGDQDLPRRPASRATSVKAEPGSSATSVGNQDQMGATSDGSKPGCWTSGEETEGEDRVRGTGTGSSSSYGSFLRTTTDDSSKEMLWERSDNSLVAKAEAEREAASRLRPVLKDPPWEENVNVTPDLLLRYQITKRPVSAVLEQDLRKLNSVTQPTLVNEQLGQLYADMARLATDGDDSDADLSLHLSEAEFMSSSGSGAEDGTTSTPRVRHKMCGPLEYSKLVMLFEENAPMPSPTPCSQPA